MILFKVILFGGNTILKKPIIDLNKFEKHLARFKTVVRLTKLRDKLKIEKKLIK